MDSSHRSPARLVESGWRQWQHREPVLDERLDGGRAELVGDRLQPGGIIGGGEPVGQGAVADPGVAAWRLAHPCPLIQILAG